MPWIYRIVGVASLIANSAVLTARYEDTGRAAPPIAAAAVAPAPLGHRARVERADDGLFHLSGQRGGQTVDFVVDTGASVTVLTEADADRLNASPLSGTDSTTLATAGGQTAMTWRRLRSITIAGRHLGQIDVAVVKDGIGRSLLGQDALARLGTIVIADDRLEVSPSS